MNRGVHFFPMIRKGSTTLSPKEKFQEKFNQAKYERDLLADNLNLTPEQTKELERVCEKWFIAGQANNF